MNSYSLSEGSLLLIMQGQQIESPIMQVLGSKKIATSSSDKERYRILLSDGRNCISFAMFTTQVNSRLESGELPTFSIIKIKRYITSVINNTGKNDKRVLVILDFETIVPGDKVKSKIGSPEQISDDYDSNSKSSETPTQPMKNEVSSVVISKPSRSTPQQNGINMDQTFQEQLTHPISSLSPYQNKWIIRARVTNKSSIRTWSNSRGEGKLFSMDLLDETGEIRATAFRDAVDKFYDYIEIDKVYYITKCQLKMANKAYSTLRNDYEMTLTNETVIQLCDEIANIPQTQYDFIQIDKISQLEIGAFIDVVGVCKNVSEIQTFQARSTGKELKKREIIIVDQTDNGIALTLWGNDAENFDGSANPIVVIKSAKVGEFGGGKNLSVAMASVMKINPDISEAHRLRGWYDNGGVHKEVKNISARSGGNFQTSWMNFRAVKDQALGNSERGDYFQTKATILLIRSEKNCLYKACPSEDCNKKLLDLENGMFRCDKCIREYPNFKYRLIGSMNVCDWSGNQWVTLFSAEAEKILGATAAEIGQAFEANEHSLKDIADKANFKQYIFKCRAKFEMYNDENRLKTVVVKVDPVNYKEYNSHLISRINELMN